MGIFLVQPLQWWARISPPGWNRVKVSENVGAPAVAPVAHAVMSLNMTLQITSYFIVFSVKNLIFRKIHINIFMIFLI